MVVDEMVDCEVVYEMSDEMMDEMAVDEMRNIKRYIFHLSSFSIKYISIFQ